MSSWSVSTIETETNFDCPFGICVASLSPVLTFFGDMCGVCRIAGTVSSDGGTQLLRIDRIVGGAGIWIVAQLAFSADRNALFAVDNSHHGVRRLNLTTMKVDTVAGTPMSDGHRDGAAKQAQFNDPWGIVLDADGSLLISDRDNHCLRRLSADLALVETVAGVPGQKGSQDGAAKQATFNWPRGLAADVNGDVLIADFSNKLVRRLHDGEIGRAHV